jgi:hypothetical protein
VMRHATIYIEHGRSNAKNCGQRKKPSRDALVVFCVSFAG